ncbi:hypothetical protein OAP56_01420 [Rickettsiaceae bacterium]|nr:hypothetical protein [Rickettsiaceae bacterium]
MITQKDVEEAIKNAKSSHSSGKKEEALGALHGVITRAHTENTNITRNTVVMQCTEEMLKIDPHNADAITSRAEVLHFRDKPNEAIDLLNSGAQHES